MTTESMSQATGFNDPNVLQLNARTGSEHPDRKKGERFLMYGNPTTHSIYQTEGHLNVRRGKTVIDDFGRDRTADAGGEFFPLFAPEVELQN